MIFINNYNYDKWKESIPSQAGYDAVCTVNGYDLGVGAFSSPSDIYYNDTIFYIADTGNNRIIAVNSDFKSAVRTYETFTYPDGTQTTLKSPSGIFADRYIYIADTDNSRVLVSDYDGNIIHEITKPDSVIYDQSKTFMPQKVIADKSGNIYIALNNITSGAAVFSAEGDFSGFFGADKVNGFSDALSDYLSFLFVSDSKRARRTRSIPTGISNFDIEGDFVFTCTSSRADSVKKLNASGDNIFAKKELTFGDYAPMYDTTNNRLLASEIVDIDISENGYINCLDRTAGRIFQYDRECNLIFITGGTGKQTGLFQQVCAIESADNRIFVLDSMKNNVTIFQETEFGDIVHQATDLYNDGYYAESLPLWQNVLRRDGNYRLAYEGLSSAYLRTENYKESMYYSELADNQKLYDKAFQGYRREFIQTHFELFFCVIVMIVGAVLIRKIRRKRK